MRFDRIAAWTAPLFVGLVLSPLLVGYEPVGGDPDRIFRPIKSELARALRANTLPFWSDNLGFGIPLVAESHVGALYPPNHVLYRVFDVSMAYRLSMWLHNVLLAAATFAYARALKITPWGAALAGVSFTLCGFQAIHSSHEWAYQALLYVPLILLATEKYLEGGRLLWMGLLALFTGMAWTIGHFQVQTWTHAIVAIVVLWRVLFDRRPFIRSVGVFAALMWGGLIGAAQLGPSWELARFVGQENRDRLFYSFPPTHWIELVFPQIFRGIHPEDPYWFKRQTTGYEACFYVGTIPMIFALIGLFSRNRGTQVWKILVALTMALATMPQWWAQGYQWFLVTPGLGFFRCPARWTLFASLGLALLAGAGFDRAVRGRWFWAAMAGVVVVLTLAVLQRISNVELVDYLRSGEVGMAIWVWPMAIASVVGWRAWRGGGTESHSDPSSPDAAPRSDAGSVGRAPLTHPTWMSFLLVGLTAYELGYLYYHMTTQWGWPVRLERDSPIFKKLLELDDVGLVAGRFDNLPLRVGLRTGDPYVGFNLPEPNRYFRAISAFNSPVARVGWHRGMSITHQVLQQPDADAMRRLVDLALSRGAEAVWSGADPALQKLAIRVGKPDDVEANGLYWALLRLPDPLPAVRIVTSVRRPAAGMTDIFYEAQFVPELALIANGDDLPELKGRWATSTRLRSWSGDHGVVEHDGACGLVLNRTYYPGWRYRVNGGDWRAVSRVNGGIQALWIDGVGVSKVETRYFVTGWPVVAGASLLATLLALGVCAWSAWPRRKSAA